MGEIVVGLIGLIGTITVSLIGVYVGKKYKIGPNQDKLVQTLQDIVAAQDKKIVQLQETVETSNQLIRKLTQEVQELRAVTISQALLIEELNKRLKEK